MKLPAFATRLLLSTAISSTCFPLPACAQTPPPTPDQPTVAPTPSPAPAPQPMKPAQLQAYQAEQLKQQQKAMRDMQLAIDRDRRSLDDAAKNMDPNNPFVLAGTNRPALLITRPIDGRAIEEWTEDLKIMDKLLRTAVTHAGDDDVPTAMGIKLTTLGRTPPTYIEDAGVLFALGVNFPLAPSPNAADKASAPSEPESVWDRAKRDLDGRDNPKNPEPRAPLSFDQSKVDTLLNALITTLPQAANFRHLDESNFIFVTITSTDTARTPLRMTLKAKKSDINDAFHKTITPDDFKKRVTWHIG